MFNTNIKRWVLFALLVLVAFGVGWLIYRLMWQPSSTTVPPTSDTNNSTSTFPTAETGGQPNIIINPEELPTAGTENTTDITDNTITTPETIRDNKITQRSSNNTLNPTIAPDGGLQYYDRYSEKFYRLDTSGETQELVDKTFPNVQTIDWATDKTKAVMSFPDGSKIIYDFSSNRQVTLPSHWEEIKFSPDSNRLAFKSMGNNADNIYVGIVNADGSGARSVEKIGNNADKVIISWSPSGQVIAMLTEGDSFDGKTVYFMGLNKENFRSLNIEGRGFQPLWSPSGSQLLYSIYSSANQYKPSLWITNASGEDIGNSNRPLNLNTYAKKCTFVDNSNIYCAVPRSLPEGAGLIESLSKDSLDNLYLINTITGEKQVIDIGGNYNINNLLYSETEKALYFMDSRDNQMHRLSLI
ncbi:hypothetical protein COT94_01750 [Candidatus Falkowbacteria bacterium CG10_big_fil_rev_8_21_14_0_10_37_14]|uniref:Dipeptidylpeptidase IV N-terminal domain-containing protein n=1 Tax=Candidatus Falkowbacteria bacterium CG10_big_fil_rev_8_21_14_0_10_37_14 TaxID=1974561 RepID=A0A2M6WTQ5_9BACT|nr:hypothetical protein [Candidatus Falkowbacteria bacterium]PIT96170.1 MAG: hypothetical protein COT94_01750 [Candidatus Falkowbacteria bacterium CG10_big_fil_rev_8_21_14_0_10_37_14]